MLYPSLQSLLNQINSRYLLVNIIARRARDITSQGNDYDGDFYEKPVSKAIDEIAAGELMVSVPEDL